MKANQKFRKEVKEVTPVLGTMLMLPIVLIIISALTMWSQRIMDEMNKAQMRLEIMSSKIKTALENFSGVVNISGASNQSYPNFSSNVLWHDDFEGYCSGLKWETDRYIEYNGGRVWFSCDDEFEHVYS